MEGMAAQQAAHSQPDTPRDAIPGNGFQHVFRASRMKAAGRGQERRQEPFVETQSGDNYFPHCVTSRSNSRLSSSGEASKAARRGLITISHCGPISGNRIRRTSRSRLLTRFRATALPKLRGTVNPSLGPWLASRGTCRQNAAKYGPAIRLPWLYALRKSEVLRIRALFGKPKLIGVPDGPLVADRKLMTALGAAPRQHRPPILGAHAHPEPMGLGPFAIVRLKCTFWHWISPARDKRPETLAKYQYTTRPVRRPEGEYRIRRPVLPLIRGARRPWDRRAWRAARECIRPPAPGRPEARPPHRRSADRRR